MDKRLETGCCVWLRVDYGCRRLRKPTSPLTASSIDAQQNAEIYTSPPEYLCRLNSEFRHYRKPTESVLSLVLDYLVLPSTVRGRMLAPGPSG